LKKKLNNTWEKYLKYLTNIGKLFDKIWKIFEKNLKNIWEKFEKYFRKVWKPFDNKLKNIWEKLLEYLIKIWKIFEKYDPLFSWAEKKNHRPI